MILSSPETFFREFQATSLPLLFSSLLTLILFLRAAFSRRSRSAFHRLPGPKPSSRIWGCEWDIHSSRPGEKYLEWAAEFGALYKYKAAFGQTKLVISDPVAVHHILGLGAYTFPKPKGARKFFEKLLGRGLLHSEGEDHVVQRRILAPAFNTQAVLSLAPKFHSTAIHASENISSIGQGKKEFDIDIAHHANLISLDAVSTSSFSYDLGIMNTDVHPLVSALDAMTSSTASHSYTSFIVKALVFLFPAILDLPTRRGKTIKASHTVLSDITKSVLASSLSDEDDSCAKRSALALLAEAKEQQSSKHQLTPDQISAQVMGLIFAGYETTSTTISWITHYLCRHPEIQERLREEIMSVGTDNLADLRGGEYFPLLEAVVKETLRVQPPVNTLHRVTTRDSVVPLQFPVEGSNSILIPKDTIIVIPINVMQQNRRSWTDPEVWNPDRWLEEMPKPSGPEGRYKRDLIAFSDGPRGCIGKAFALFEIKIVLCTLLQQFRFSPAKEGEKELEIETFLSFVVRPRVKDAAACSLPVHVTRL